MFRTLLCLILSFGGLSHATDADAVRETLNRPFIWLFACQGLDEELPTFSRRCIGEPLSVDENLTVTLATYAFADRDSSQRLIQKKGYKVSYDDIEVVKLPPVAFYGQSELFNRRFYLESAKGIGYEVGIVGLRRAKIGAKEIWIATIVPLNQFEAFDDMMMRDVPLSLLFSIGDRVRVPQYRQVLSPIYQRVLGWEHFTSQPLSGTESFDLGRHRLIRRLSEETVNHDCIARLTALLDA